MLAPFVGFKLTIAGKGDSYNTGFYEYLHGKQCSRLDSYSEIA